MNISAHAEILWHFSERCMFHTKIPLGPIPALANGSSGIKTACFTWVSFVSFTEESAMDMWKTVLSAMMLCVLAACASTTTPQPGTGLQSGNGVIENINVVQANGSSGLGAVVGGVAGGLLGNQIGSGTGQTAATVAGAAAGAYAGNQYEKNRQQGKVQYQFGVRMENGLYQSLTQDSNPFKVGDRVRITDGKLTHR